MLKTLKQVIRYFINRKVFNRLVKSLKVERRVGKISQEKEFGHLHIMLAHLLGENINVHICLYYVNRCISKLLFTFFGQYQK